MGFSYGWIMMDPSAPPSYDEAMTAGSQSKSSNHPANPYSSHGMPNHGVPHPVPLGVPVFPNQMASATNPTGPQPVPYGVSVYPNQIVNMPNPPAPVVPVIGVTTTQIMPVGPKRMRMRCHHCGADIKSTTTTSNKASAHIACLILCFFTCCLCFWIPYCMSSCKKVDHKCPNCQGFLGTYNG